MAQQVGGLTVYEAGMTSIHGAKVAFPYREAWNHETKRRGVVDLEGNFIETLPLNGWRERNLAQSITGERDGNMWREAGKAMIVSLEDLMDLPGFDQHYMDVLDELHKNDTKVVTIQVVVVDPSYGSHITVTPARGTK